jgi:5-enolpyruvylshikimate-3-phosphate synthase
MRTRDSISNFNRFCDEMRKHGVQFSASILVESKSGHRVISSVNAHDDHRMIDMLAEQFELWKKKSHE